MITILPVRTGRINAVLRELTIRDAIFLCKLPASQAERGTTELLNRIIEQPEKVLPGQVTSVRSWTVEERAFVVAHYMAHVLEDGPDFAIGKQGRYSHYLLHGQDTCAPWVDLGAAGGSHWKMRPLLGGFAESIERLIMSEELPDSREGWLVGAMACQLVADDEADFDLESSLDAVVDEYVTKSAIKLFDLKESEFLELLDIYLSGADKLRHLLDMQIGDCGAVFLPVTEEVQGLPPARFHFPLAVRRGTEEIFGQPDRGSGGDEAVLWGDDGQRDEPVAVRSEDDLREHGIYELEESSRS